jgi:inosine-uridine nucleoside N-ribohydrolase
VTTMRVLALTLLLAAAGCGRPTADPADDRRSVWLDISPAIGDPPRDPGDALALLQAHGAPQLRLRGVSITFGNVPLVRGYPAAVELLDRLDTGLLRPWRGPSSPEERAAPTEATELLAEALGESKLTVLSLGPATTLASVLLRHPGLAAQIERVVFIGGQTRTATGEALTADVNVAADPQSLQVVLDSGVALTLVPAGAATGVALDTRDLDDLEARGGPLALVIPGARAWLQAVTNGTSSTTFPIPALVAVDVAAHPGEVRCEIATATLQTSPAPALVVWSAPGLAGRRITWCHTADPGAKPRILAALR